VLPIEEIVEAYERDAIAPGVAADDKVVDTENLMWGGEETVGGAISQGYPTLLGIGIVLEVEEFGIVDAAVAEAEALAIVRPGDAVVFAAMVLDDFQVMRGEVN
jgi:hypothetical protein